MKIMNYWGIFQAILGIWLFISPFAIGFEDLTPIALNNMIVGGVVGLTGIGAFLFEIYHRGEICRLDEMQKRAS